MLASHAVLRRRERERDAPEPADAEADPPHRGHGRTQVSRRRDLLERERRDEPCDPGGELSVRAPRERAAESRHHGKPIQARALR
jgi:hypothetical protein